MSSSPQIDGGGGGGGSTDDSTSGSTDSSDPSDTTLVTFTRDELRKLAIVINNPTVWVVAALTGFTIETTFQLLQQKSAVAIVIDDYLFRTILLPIGLQLFVGGINIINEFILLLFGTDRAVGVFPGTRPGLVDTPILFVSPFVQTFITAGLTIFNVVDIFNKSFVDSLPGLGIAAPAVVNILFAVETLAILYGLWLLISFVPVLNVRGVLLSMTSIPRRVLNRLL